MDLRKRLAQLDGLSRKKVGAAKGDDALWAAPEPESLARMLAEHLKMVPQQGGPGPCWRRDYGARRLDPPPVPLPGRGALFPQPGAADLCAEDLLLLDTETTGLVGGTGSLAFLIGLAWWQKEGFVVRQYFLAGPGQEDAMLAEIERIAGRFRVVVTYNGNGFDLPLLRTRAMLSRRADPLAGLTSWDLLTPARRLWNRRLANCRQQTVEEMIRGDRRGPGDIEGVQIPQTYFRFLREGEIGGLPEVLRHNRRDMEGMGEIIAAVFRAAALLEYEPAVGDSAQSVRCDLAWQDAWSLGRICEARRDTSRAAAWLRLALERASAPAATVVWPERFLVDTVRIFKRDGDWSRVESILRRGLDWYPVRPWLHREAAMLYEHRLGRPDLALVHAETEGDAHRLARLRRKLAAADAG